MNSPSSSATSGVRTLDDARLEREILVWLGANGALRDGDGGAYALTSPGRPVGALTRIDGAAGTIESGARRAICTAAPERDRRDDRRRRRAP